MKQFIGIILLCAALARGQVDVCDESIFICKPGREDFSTLVIDNKQYELACIEGEKCNAKHKNTAEQPCTPCIVPSQNCDKAFECTNGKNREIEINGFSMLCPEYEVCNADFEEGCKPCLPKRCPDEHEYECSKSNPDYYVLGENEFKCRTGFTCNSDYFSPCQKCILKSRQRLLRLGFDV